MQNEQNEARRSSPFAVDGPGHHGSQDALFAAGNDPFRQLFESASAAFVVMDEAGTIRMVNRPAELLFSYPREKLLGEKLEILIPERFRNAHILERQQYIKVPKTRQMGVGKWELFGRRADGSDVPLEIGLSPLMLGGQMHVLASIIDITGRKLIDDELHRNIQAFQKLAHNSPDIIARFDRQLRHLYVNPAVEKATGRPAAEFIGKTNAELGMPEDLNAFWSTHLNQVFETGKEISLEFEFPSPTGVQYFHSYIVPEFDLDGVIISLLSVTRDVTERKHYETELKNAYENLRGELEKIENLKQELAEQALRDPLTNLHNRRYLTESLGRELIRCQREAVPLGLIVMDIDHFKQVNDTHGHQAGDQLLVAVAEVLRNHARGSDILCRYGGEEFLLVMPAASEQDTFTRAEELRQKCAAIQLPDQPGLFMITLSFGIASFPAHGKTMDELLNNADKALYASKRNGRNRVTVWNAEIFY